MGDIHALRAPSVNHRQGRHTGFPFAASVAWAEHLFSLPPSWFIDQSPLGKNDLVRPRPEWLPDMDSNHD